ncbi:immunoglobulin superfamily member 1-like [Engraulis encrasicolus]|uniref:immunoglobulin superfamily member 1-like n=1 Tax=Engraulis encrasicolus TaxID=184585 RepID=UPI002FD2AFDE
MGLFLVIAFRPASISANIPVIFEDENLELRCAIQQEDEEQREELFMYLCKDAAGIRMKKFTGSTEVVFDFPNVTKEDSGMYTCVYSRRQQKVSEVTPFGMCIVIRVKDVLMASVFIRNPLVTEGDTADIKCLVPGRKQGQNTFYVYLCKNGVGENIAAVHRGNEAFFTLTQVRVEDSGNYSCLASAKLHPYQSIRSTNENSMALEVTDFRSGEIFSRQTEVLEGYTIELRCAISPTAEMQRAELHVYLSKNGTIIRMELVQNSKDVVFRLHSVKKDVSGNYSCAFSENRSRSNRVVVVREKFITIHLRDFFMAHAFIANHSAAKGDSVDIRCSVLERDVHQAPVYMHLCKDGAVVKTESVPITSGEASFTFSQVTSEDSGNYSCVYTTRDHFNSTGQ